MIKIKIIRSVSFGRQNVKINKNFKLKTKNTKAFIKHEGALILIWGFL